MPKKLLGVGSKYFFGGMSPKKYFYWGGGVGTLGQ